MIKFLVTAAIVLICLFILVVWVVMRLLRWLFPDKFKGKAGKA